MSLPQPLTTAQQVADDVRLAIQQANAAIDRAVFEGLRVDIEILTAKSLNGERPAIKVDVYRRV